MRVNFEPGTLVASRYRLDRFLGEGGMGAVWAATHTITQRRYALKFLKAPDHSGGELRRRFAREARAASAVDHPNVVIVHDVFELDDRTPVMVMDLLEGETLRTKLKRDAPLSVEEAATLLLPAVSAVGAAHAAGIVHRDLKPDNVFLEKTKAGGVHVRVLDFGIAKLVGSDGTPLETAGITGTGALLGTPVYMSPEQGFGEKDIDHRADIWALGVVLYEALSGIRPVEGDNIGQVLKRLLNDGITPLEVIEPDLPAELTKMVGSMLSREREDRPADLRPVRDLLAQLSGADAPEFGAPSSMTAVTDVPSDPGAASSASAVVVDPSASHDGATEEMTPSGGDTHGPTSISVAGRRPRLGRYIAASALVAGLGAGSWAALRGGDVPVPPVPSASAASTAPAPVASLASPAPSALAPAEAEDDDAGVGAEAPASSEPPEPFAPRAAAGPRRQARLRPAPPRAPAPRVVAPPSRPEPAPAPAPKRAQGLVDEPPF